MGLDTSHDCWHGPYSSFMEWRVLLHHYITGEEPTRERLVKAWDMKRYEDQSIPINVLMNHSDCDGEIPAEMCGFLADALQSIADRMADPRANYSPRWMTERFIAGLRKAAAAGEAVEFH